MSGGDGSESKRRCRVELVDCFEMDCFSFHKSCNWIELGFGGKFRYGYTVFQLLDRAKADPEPISLFPARLPCLSPVSVKVVIEQSIILFPPGRGFGVFYQNQIQFVLVLGLSNRPVDFVQVV